MQVIATGGKAIEGAPLGILMLEARFPRIPGDMGNAGTWPFPVLYRVVRGATPARVVLNAAAELVHAGAEAINHKLRLPVAVPGGTGGPCARAGRHQRTDPGAWVQVMPPPGRRVGIITVSAPARGKKLAAVRAGVHQHAALRVRAARRLACRSMTSTRWSPGYTPDCSPASSVRQPIGQPVCRPAFPLGDVS
jgi:hypothetical protein